MRYEKGRKDVTRQHIVAVASRRFREDGVEAVGIARLMADAGLTHGGFYSHFGSKEDLVQAAVTDALDRTQENMDRAAQEGGGLEAIVRSYLRASHRDNPGQGCAVACLAAELARHPLATRDAVTERLQRFVGLIAEHLPAADPRVRRDGALAIFGLMVGTLQLARTVSDPVLSDQILASGVTAAAAIAASCRDAA